MNFSHTYIDAPRYAEDDIVIHYYDPQLPDRYGSNFMIFKKMPSLAVFQRYEAKQHDFHQHHHMSHLRFLFPEGETFSNELQTYIENRTYEIGTLELYAMLPIHFQGRLNDSVDVQYVEETTLDAYLTFQYDIDLAYGKNFATQRQLLLKRQFHDPDIQLLMAQQAQEIVGGMTLFVQPHIVELDSFVVKESYQRQHIGSTMQQFVMQQHTEKTAILVADGEDTAKQMYMRQGYQFCSARYEIVHLK